MDLLNGAAALTPPYRKRLHTTHGTTHKLFNHRTKISQLSSVYFELQDQSAVILRVGRPLPRPRVHMPAVATP
eukprot:m.212822 g.212822  ORF g.212822 m.212822 type:complete len:73 (-) comp25541_c0_seq2:236-454(-)